MSEREGVSNFREIDADGNTATDTGPVTADGRAGGTAGPEGMELLLRVNPFIGLLWLLAASLVGIGLWFLKVGSAGLSGMTSGPGPEFYFMMMNLAPWALVVGVSVLACLLFWHANRWQKRRDRLGA